MKAILEKILGQGSVRVNESMARHTTFRIGGPADYFVTPSCEQELSEVIKACRDCSIPFFIIGNGSNLLVSDSGIRGVVIQLGENFSQIDIVEEAEDFCVVYAQAGATLARLASFACDHGLSGLEFASGIPGTVGGALVMNAGAYGGEMVQCTAAGKYLDVDAAGSDDCIKILEGEAQGLTYRHSAYQDMNAVILGGYFRLSRDKSREEILALMKDLNGRRRDKQPLEYPSAGSTFKRPVGGYAAQLIESAGLKGLTVGGAQVSKKHSGFIINIDHATCSDVEALISRVSDIVFEKSGIRLETEVKKIGE